MRSDAAVAVRKIVGIVDETVMQSTRQWSAILMNENVQQYLPDRQM
jgi:hypothetical protein